MQEDLLGVALVALVQHIQARAQSLLEVDEMLGDFVFQVINLVNKHLFLLLLLAFVVVYTLFEGELRLREPGQGIRVLLHVAVKVLEVEVRLPSGHLIEDCLEVLQIQGHYTN